MLRKSILIALLALALAITLGGSAASAPLRSVPSEPEPDAGRARAAGIPDLAARERGDAPEGGLAYPALGIFGNFPTCESLGPAGDIQHGNWGAVLGPSYDFEGEGNAGQCPGCFPLYDQDECFADFDAGLITPQPFTIDSSWNVVTCPNSQGTALANACQTVAWGSDVDILVTNFMPSSTPGLMNVLVDWNQNGQWGDTISCPGAGPISEHVLVNFVVPNGFSGPLSALGPPGFLAGRKSGHVWARFSITEQPVAFPWSGSGSFEDGESEDYLLLVDPMYGEQLDWGDAPDPTYPTLAASIGANHFISAGFLLGNRIDAEADGQPNPAALGDDNNGVDDEDGVTFTSALVPGQPATVDVFLTDATGLGGLLNAWIDFDGNGVWNGPQEQIFINQPLAPGNNVGLLFSVPGTALTGPTFARFRLSQQGGLGPAGSGGIGEVEDYKLQISTAEPQNDWGDAPDPTYPTLNASGGANHLVQAGFMLGVAIDAEADGQPDPNALGDDNDANGDDEDGVTFTTPLLQGQPVNFTVTASAAGALDAWIDFNGNGTWEHPVEHLFGGVSAALAAGPNNFAVIVPLNAAAGPTFARFRLSQQGGLGPAGAGGAGEVEDYQVMINPVLTITKTVTAPIGGVATISDTVTFKIVIHNAGTLAVTTLPLWDYYSPACLENPVAVPAPNGPGTDPALGVLHWTNVGPLAAGGSLTVMVSFHANRTTAMYWKEGGWLDYAPKGMPDIDQKQDQWDNPAGSGAAWYYCGPVAAANSLWWFDSKFEPNPLSPPAINDGYPIVTAPAAALYDDHSPANVQNFVNTLAGWMGTMPGGGTNVNNLAAGIQAHLANVGVGAQYSVTVPPVAKPTFEWVADEVRRSEDVILLLGFYEDVLPGADVYWERTGGHFVTVAGVDLQDQRIAFSDPYYDRAELGAPWYGRVLPAPHLWLHPGVPTGEVHNDVKYLSQDVYQVQDTSSPGGIWGPVGYVDPDSMIGCPQISNFDGQNDPSGAINQGCVPHPDYSLVAEVEYAVAVSPITKTITCDPTTNIAVVSGAVDASGSELPEVQAHAEVHITQKDWGDAPDPGYPTLSASNGAVHTLSSGLWLGATVDPEQDGQPDPGALGDDNDANGDDEDGVAFTTPLLPGQLARITVIASAPGLLDAWFDFNGNGTWEHPGEHLWGGPSVTVNAGANDLNFTVPAGAVVGQTFARFRLSNLGGLSPFGPAVDGEVEDYRVKIHDPSEYKWSQPYDPILSGLHTHDDGTTGIVSWITRADDWQCRGGLITDLEWWGNYELDAYGVEKRGSGIDHFHLSIHSADPTGLPFPGPVAWQADVPFAAVSETSIGVANPEGSTLYHYRFVLPMPVIQVPGGTYWFDIAARSVDPMAPAIWRWQESSRGAPYQGLYPAASRTDSDLGPGSWSSSTSDMAFVISSKPADLGDAPDSLTAPRYPTLLANNGASHALEAGGPRMGAAVDTDLDGQPTLQADGDDIDADGDDEDGVILASALVPGRAVTVTVRVAGPPPGCYLNGWLDANIDGDWSDAREQIFTDAPLIVGANTLTFTLTSAYTPTVGLTYARFRCSTLTGLGYNGPAPDGEVEDYRWQIMAPPRRPVLSIAITNTTGVRLSWPQVALDIYGNTITADGYRIYRASAPYAALSQVASVWAPFPPGPVVWDDAGKVGDPTVNYYYTVDTVLRDIYGNEVYSRRSNEVAEFDFALTPGSP